MINFFTRLIFSIILVRINNSICVVLLLPTCKNEIRTAYLRCRFRHPSSISVLRKQVILLRLRLREGLKVSGAITISSSNRKWGTYFFNSGVTCVSLQIYAMRNTACVNVKDNFEMNDNFTVECVQTKAPRQPKIATTGIPSAYSCSWDGIICAISLKQEIKMCPSFSCSGKKWVLLNSLISHWKLFVCDPAVVSYCWIKTLKSHGIAVFQSSSLSTDTIDTTTSEGNISKVSKLQ